MERIQLVPLGAAFAPPFWGIKVPQKAVISLGVLIMLKKLDFCLSYGVFLKDNKIVYFTLKKKGPAKQCNLGQMRS